MQMPLAGFVPAQHTRAIQADPGLADAPAGCGMACIPLPFSAPEGRICGFADTHNAVDASMSSFS
jgi:hypothetical protein